MLTKDFIDDVLMDEDRQARKVQARHSLREWIGEPGELEVPEDAPVATVQGGHWVQCWAFIDDENVEG